MIPSPLGCVDILSAEQTQAGESWYQGTADAVRQNMHHFGATEDDDLYVILSGDQLYRMNLRAVVEEHDASVGGKSPSPQNLDGLEEASELGLMRINDQLEIEEFVENRKSLRSLTA